MGLFFRVGVMEVDLPPDMHDQVSWLPVLMVHFSGQQSHVSGAIPPTFKEKRTSTYPRQHSSE
jgi:hypothetical protein